MSKEEIIQEMLKAYYAVVFPGKTLDEVGKGGLAITYFTMQLIYDGKEAWGNAEEAAEKKMLELRKTE